VDYFAQKSAKATLADGLRICCLLRGQCSILLPVVYGPEAALSISNAELQARKFLKLPARAISFDASPLFLRTLKRALDWWLGSAERALLLGSAGRKPRNEHGLNAILS